MNTRHLLRLLLWTGSLAAGAGAAGGSAWAGTTVTGRPWVCHVIDASSRGADGVRLADINGDGLPDITTGWEEGGLTRVYLNPGPSRAALPWPTVTVGRTASVEDAMFADLDGDGRPEVVSCCEGRCRSIYIHRPPADRNRLLAADRWRQVVLPASVGTMQWMFAAAIPIDDRDGPELVAGGKGSGAAVGWFEAPTDPSRWDRYTWHPISPVGWVMSIIPADMDGDGDTDLLITDRKGPHRACRWLENPGPASAGIEPWPSHVIGGAGREVMFCKMADVDGDGLTDVVVPVHGGPVLICRRLDRTGRRWQCVELALPDGIGGPKAVAVDDFNRDGRTDLALTSESAAGKHGVYWLAQPADWTDQPWPAHAISGTQRGIKYDRIELIDLDGDGDRDLLTCEERQDGRGMGVIWYENPLRSSP